jgi:uncharacterized glyoxalase superfamily protein PhnB
MTPSPEGWPRLSSAIVYRDCAAMIDWLCEAFDFAVRIKIEGQAGEIHHSELTYGEAVIMPAQEKRGDDRFGVKWLSPLTAGGITQSLMLYVDDVDAHCARARAHGANISTEPEDHDYGDEHWADRSYSAVDPEGHLWIFAQRLRTKGV